MALEDTKTTEDIRSTKDLNKFLEKEWVLISTYVVDVGELGAPSAVQHFVVAWQKETTPNYPLGFPVKEYEFKPKSVI
jgi:UPF0288 family protein (methanogenesis marker protein 3)